MREGFNCDQAYGTILVSRWVEGPPERSLLTGVKAKGRTMLETRTFRCERCGFLERRS
jgi:hypothetical protein